MPFSLIIPTKDRNQILVDTLNRVNQIRNVEDIEVIIINDSNEALSLPHFTFPIRIFRNPGSGVAAARNFGASKAESDWLIFMDDDMWVEPETFLQLYPFLGDENKCLNVNWVYPEFLMRRMAELPFLRYLHHYGFDSLEGWFNSDKWNNEAPFRAQGITSQFLLMHRSVIRKTGGYNEFFPFAGFEDHSMSDRLRDHNIEIWIDPKNMIFHNEADRIEVGAWLERRKRGSITRRVAVHLGHHDVRLSYSALKKMIYQGAYFFRKPVLYCLGKWPFGASADGVYRLMVNVMLGTYACIGYTGPEALTYIREIDLNSGKGMTGPDK